MVDILPVLLIRPCCCAGCYAVGSIPAEKRGRHLDGWSVFGLQIARCKIYYEYADGGAACSMQPAQHLNVMLAPTSHKPDEHRQTQPTNTQKPPPTSSPHPTPPARPHSPYTAPSKPPPPPWVYPPATTTTTTPATPTTRDSVGGGLL